jgi:hypothetical protein
MGKRETSILPKVKVELEELKIMRVPRWKDKCKGHSLEADLEQIMQIMGARSKSYFKIRERMDK